jgi:hypothetical protein
MYEHLRENTGRDGHTQDTSLVRRRKRCTHAGMVRYACASSARHGRPERERSRQVTRNGLTPAGRSI